MRSLKLIGVLLIFLALIGLGIFVISQKSPGQAEARAHAFYYDYSRADWGANPAWDSRLAIYAPATYRVTSPDLDSGRSYQLLIRKGQLISLPDQAQIPTGIVVHDTATPNDPGCTYENSVKTLQAIQRDHALNAFGHVAWGGAGQPDPRLELDNRGLPDSSSGDVGYHFLIDCGGRVFEGRAGGIYYQGQHVHRHNQGQIGIALIGSFNRQPPSPAQRAALIKLLTRLCRDLGINPLAAWLEPLLDGTKKGLVKNGRAVLSLAGHNEMADNDHTDPGLLDMAQVRRDIVKAFEPSAKDTQPVKAH